MPAVESSASTEAEELPAVESPAPGENEEPSASIEKPSVNPAIQIAIQHNIDTKLKALDEKDLELYLSTVTNNDEYYFNEQGRWFREMTKSIYDISFEILDIEIRDEGIVVANIRQ